MGVDEAGQNGPALKIQHGGPGSGQRLQRVRRINRQDFSARSGQAAGDGSMVIQCADPSIQDKKIDPHCHPSR